MPFLVAAAAVIALMAGARSRWRTQADVADEQAWAKTHPMPAGPPIQGWGDTMRWFFWYMYYHDKLTPVGPFHVSDSQAFDFEENTHRDYLGVKIYRFVWPGKNPWVYDTRRSAALLAGEPIPASVAGVEVGAVAVVPPLRGKWTAPGYPASVTVNGRTFQKAVWQWPRSGVIAQYREAVPVDSHHLFVLQDGTFVVDHYDESNPDHGRLLEHILNDVLLRPSGVVRA